MHLIGLGAAGFPADVINEAVMRAIDTEKYAPATATVLETAARLVDERYCRLQRSRGRRPSIPAGGGQQPSWRRRLNLKRGAKLN